MGLKKDHEAQNGIINFLQQQDISYCSPSRKDTIYYGKHSAGKCHTIKKMKKRQVITNFEKP